MSEQSEECFVCAKHVLGDAAEGGVLYRDELVYAGHMHTLGRGSVYAGYLMAEPIRHVEGWGLLDDSEAAALGQLINRLARALRVGVGANHVYTFVYGGGVAHLHVHVVPRYPDTPREYWGGRVQEWPDAPTVTAETMRGLTEQLQLHLRSNSPIEG